MDHQILATTSPPPRPNLPSSKHVLPPRLPKPRCHHLQRPQSDQNSISGIVLLLDYAEETIAGADDGAIGTVDGGIGYGEGIAHGYAGSFLLDG